MIKTKAIYPVIKYTIRIRIHEIGKKTNVILKDLPAFSSLP